MDLSIHKTINLLGFSLVLYVLLWAQPLNIFATGAERDHEAKAAQVPLRSRMVRWF